MSIHKSLKEITCILMDPKYHSPASLIFSQFYRIPPDSLLLKVNETESHTTVLVDTGLICYMYNTTMQKCTHEVV